MGERSQGFYGAANDGVVGPAGDVGDKAGTATVMFGARIIKPETGRWSAVHGGFLPANVPN
jgi:hypothetical protein